MSDPVFLLAFAAAGTAAVGVAAAAGLKGWRDWLEVRRLEIEHKPLPKSPTSTRLEIAELRNRVRRLEGIANGGEG